MPYSDLPPKAFWSRCRATPGFAIGDLFTPKFPVTTGTQIATAGSCFAQNIGKYLAVSDLHLVDTEPAPGPMPQTIAAQHGYGLFSARFGNIYIARQLFQLVQDAMTGTVHDCAIWTKAGRSVDALRPNVEPTGFSSAQELIAHRRDHLARVRQMFGQAEVFIFTLGLTETWAHRATGVVFPSAPGVIAGTYDPTQHVFSNAGFGDTLKDLQAAITLMRQINPDLRIILTVSPVPLTATASGQHVLAATTYSKAVLRAVAGELATSDPLIDYFPSYEIITGTPFKSQFFDTNLRSVTKDGVAAVMATFFAAYGHATPIIVPRIPQGDPDDGTDDTICEEAMIESLTRP